MRRSPKRNAMHFTTLCHLQRVQLIWGIRPIAAVQSIIWWHQHHSGEQGSDWKLRFSVYQRIETMTKTQLQALQKIRTMVDMRSVTFQNTVPHVHTDRVAMVDDRPPPTSLWIKNRPPRETSWSVDDFIKKSTKSYRETLILPLLDAVIDDWPEIGYML